MWALMDVSDLTFTVMSDAVIFPSASILSFPISPCWDVWQDLIAMIPQAQAEIGNVVQGYGLAVCHGSPISDVGMPKTFRVTAKPVSSHQTKRQSQQKFETSPITLSNKRDLIWRHISCLYSSLFYRLLFPQLGLLQTLQVTAFVAKTCTLQALSVLAALPVTPLALLPLLPNHNTSNRTKGYSSSLG